MPETVATPPKAPEEPPEAKQRGVSKEVQAAIWSSGGTIVAAVIAAAAAIYTGVASVPAIDGSPDVAVLEKENVTLNEQVSDLESMNAGLSNDAADLQTANDELRAEIEDLEAQLAGFTEPTPPADDGSGTTSVSDLALGEVDESGRMQAADLEAAAVSVLRITEWVDEEATADAYDIAVLGGSVSTRTQAAWSSAAGAPETKAECTTAMADKSGLYTNLSGFAVGDVICMRSSDGAIALLTLTAVDPVANSIAFRFTLFD